MTSPKNSRPATGADRVYRSPAALAGGGLLLVLAAWLGLDAMVRGAGRTPWVAVAALLFAVPLVVAYTLRPAVLASADRLLVRNPLRTITLPWAAVEDVRARYTSEVIAGGRTYQLWAIPVSLRARKKALSRAGGATAQDPYAPGAPSAGRTGATELRAPADQAVSELRELAERQAASQTAQGEPQVRWAYEIIAPAAVGAVLLAVLIATG